MDEPACFDGSHASRSFFLFTFYRLGRGAPIVNNPGNKRFRQLILKDKERYVTTSRHVMKEEIARNILNAVEERGGRFLRKLESESDRKRYNVPTGQNAWMEANDATAMQKVKQALREQKSGDGAPKRKQPSPRSEAESSKKQKSPPRETPLAATRETDAGATAVTTEAKRPVFDPEVASYPREFGGHPQGRMPSFSPSPLGRYAGLRTGEGDYPPHPFYHHNPPGQPPSRYSMYPRPELFEGSDPNNYARHYQYHGSGGGAGEIMDTRRQQAVYSALDSQARAYRLASLRAAVERDRMIRPGAPPGQQPRGAVFVSPAMGGQQRYPPPYGGEMGFPDSGG